MTGEWEAFSGSPNLLFPKWANTTPRLAFSQGERTALLDLSPLGTPWLLPPDPNVQYSPCFSPDDTQLVFHGRKSNGLMTRNLGIFVVDVDGTNLVNVWPGGADPVWRRP